MLVQPVIEESVNIVSLHAVRKNLHIITVSEFPLGLRISADLLRLRQILVNLLSNAMKFTEKGEITVAAKIEEGDLIISVKDTGIGITENMKQKIFQPFVQTDASITRRFVSLQ